MTQYQTIEVTYSGVAGNIILNRPDVHNAFDETMISEIRDVLGRLSDQENVRVIVIKARGKSFSSGADLNYMKRQSEMTEDENLKDSENLAHLFYEIYSTPRPVITISHGYIAGGANGIIAASDYAITAENAQFRFSEVHLGLVPATISPYVLDRLGRTRSMELMLSGREFTGKEAEIYGLVNKSVPVEMLEKELDTVLQYLLKSAPLALIKTKKLLLWLNDAGAKENMIKFTSEIIAGARASDEGKEGIAAFFEKQKPSWLNENIQ